MFELALNVGFQCVEIRISIVRCDFYKCVLSGTVRRGVWVDCVSRIKAGKWEVNDCVRSDYGTGWAALYKSLIAIRTRFILRPQLPM